MQPGSESALDGGERGNACTTGEGGAEVMRPMEGRPKEGRWVRLKEGRLKSWKWLSKRKGG